jgi:hypothetical protein
MLVWLVTEKEQQLKIMRDRTEEDNRRTTKLLEQIESSRKQIKDALSDKDNQLAVCSQIHTVCYHSTT